MTESPATARTGHEAAVFARYSAGARARQAELCCPVDYDRRYLDALPQEILERDYGCGDPSRFVRSGERVLDLGCGAGKICWIAAQIVGPEGAVVGVDMNDDMLALARKHHRAIAARVGYDVVVFRRGRIQDLRLDLEGRPLIPDGTIDVVLSNCVLNLVRPEDRGQLFAELFRVVAPGGRVAISDIVADEDVPQRLRADPELWSGCISGAFREDRFLEAFVAAGFHGAEVRARQDEPWRTVEGIEFRSMTVVAHKREDRPCLERNQAVIYLGPFSEVRDEEGHVFRRGERTAVCDRTFDQLERPPYAGSFALVEPRVAVPAADAGPWSRGRPALRSPRETKGEAYAATTEAAGDCCGPAPADGEPGSGGCC